MNTLYLKGDVLRIHCKDNIAEGEFEWISDDKSRITLSNVKLLPQLTPSDSKMHFYEKDITNIVKLKIPVSSSGEIILKLTEKEYENIILTSKKYKYINQVDQTFHEAIDNLNEFGYVGLSTDGAEKGRKLRMPFLVMSTPSQIYIFDTHVMQHHAFDGGLKKLLEAECPKKIVHDSRMLSDCLFHKHNVKLASVFDTQVGDLIIMKNKQGVLPESVKSLNECLTTYLGLQANIIQAKHDIVQCTERPLKTDIKDSLAKNIAFIHRLSEAINEEMMFPFIRGNECYIENIRSCDDFKAWELSGKQHVRPSNFKTTIDY